MWIGEAREVANMKAEKKLKIIQNFNNNKVNNETKPPPNNTSSAQHQLKRPKQRHNGPEREGETEEIMHTLSTRNIVSASHDFKSKIFIERSVLLLSSFRCFFFFIFLLVSFNSLYHHLNFFQLIFLFAVFCFIC